MEAQDWTAPSGIGIRELVWGLLAVARAHEPASEQEAAAVMVLMVDGEMFLEATEAD
jgi:hypothetical protein